MYQAQDFEALATKPTASKIGADVAAGFVNLTVAKSLGRKFEITKVPASKSVFFS